MATLLQTFLVLSLMRFLVPTGAKTCESPTCPMIRSPSITLNPTIQFPFRLKSQPSRCGYPGFDLSCNNRNQTIIHIPSRGGELVVTSIDYRHQRFRVNDPKNCMPGRYLVDFSVDFPFKFDSLYDRYFTYLNCTGDIGGYGVYGSLTRFDCLGGPNYTVAAVLTSEYGRRRVELPCREIRTVLVPYFGFGVGPEGDVSIKWAEPNCGACALQSGSCGFMGRSGLEVKCSLPRVSGKGSGISVGAKFGIIIGAGLFGITFFSVVAFFFSGRRGTPTDAATSVAPRPVITTGLSRPAIELYPKLTLGPEFDSPETLPNNTCPICLCKYKTSEEVRMIPDCEHYFHLNCIDLWLERNATCPLCRKPQ